MIQLEDTLAQVRKEYEMLRIEFEQTLAANEQAGRTILLPAVWLLHMLSLKDTTWSPGFFSTNWSSEVLKNLKIKSCNSFWFTAPVFVFNSDWPVLFSSSEDTFFWQFSLFIRGPRCVLSFLPCAFALTQFFITSLLLYLRPHKPRDAAPHQ